MLRVDNGNFEKHSGNVSYDFMKKPADKCKERREEYEKMRKAKCEPHKDDIEMLNDMHRRNACKVHYCVPTKKCMAKVGLHDANGNFLTQSLVSANLDTNMRINNQIGYVYQEKTLVDNDALINALRQQNPLGASVAQKIQQSNNELFGKPHAWDGTDMGYFCVPDCPKRPAPPCPLNKCKKPDPIFHPEVGIGSDGLEARRNLREINMGRNFQVRLETAKPLTNEQAIQERVAIKAFQGQANPAQQPTAPTNPDQTLRQNAERQAMIQQQALKEMQKFPQGMTAMGAR